MTLLILKFRLVKLYKPINIKNKIKNKPVLNTSGLLDYIRVNPIGLTYLYLEEIQTY